MMNLLPEPAQKKVLSDYRAHHILAGSLLLLGSAFLSVLAFLPSYAALFVTRPQEVVGAGTVSQNQTDLNDVMRAQLLVSQLGPVLSATSTASRAIRAALEARPKRVHVDHISYTKSPFNLMVVGAADGRDDINSFREAVVAEGKFSTVSIPVGALLGAQGGRFTMTLSGGF